VSTLLAVEGTAIQPGRLNRCPKCGSRVNVRKTSPAWYICPVCLHDHSRNKTTPSTEQQDWTARQVADLLVAGQSTVRPNKDRIYGVWRYLILPQFGSVRDACTALGISRSIADSVLYGNTRRPTITVLLALCRRLRINLDQLLLADVDALKPQVSGGAKVVVRKVVPRGEVDRRVAQMLRVHRADELSISKVCSAIGIATDTLRSRFPDLSKKLAALFHEGRREKKMQSRRLQLARVLKIMRSHGPNVTDRTIQRVGGFHSYGPWRELYAEARTRVSAKRPRQA
jgi:ribosomal protein L37AE/L43A/AraC-like DNA-binding protein